MESRSPYSATTVARHVIWMATKTGHGIDNLRLQKVLFWLQVFFVTELGRPCFGGILKAAGCGPIVPEVFHQFPIMTYPISKSEGTRICDMPFDEEELFWQVAEICFPLSLSQLNRSVYETDLWKNEVRSNDDYDKEFTFDMIRRYFQHTRLETNEDEPIPTTVHHELKPLRRKLIKASRRLERRQMLSDYDRGRLDTLRQVIAMFDNSIK